MSADNPTPDPASAEEAADRPQAAGAAQGTVEQMAAERDKYLDLARRTAAELENFKKRSSREMSDERKYAVKPLVGELVPVLDNLDRALAAARGSMEGSELLAGLDLVRKQFRDAFGRHGVERVYPEGEPFDPNFHEAVMQQPDAAVDPMTVLQVVEEGYRMHDRVIRPAKVVVAVAPGG